MVPFLLFQLTGSAATTATADVLVRCVADDAVVTVPADDVVVCVRPDEEVSPA